MAAQKINLWPTSVQPWNEVKKRAITQLSNGSLVNVPWLLLGPYSLIGVDLDSTSPI